jgi:hypothetical protein
MVISVRLWPELRRTGRFTTYAPGQPHAAFLTGASIAAVWPPSARVFSILVHRTTGFRWSAARRLAARVSRKRLVAVRRRGCNSSRYWWTSRPVVRFGIDGPATADRVGGAVAVGDPRDDRPVPQPRSADRGGSALEPLERPVGCVSRLSTARVGDDRAGERLIERSTAVGI